MIIILEGPDGAGKSTIVDELRARLPDARALHCGPLDGDPFVEYEGGLRSWDGYQPIICDRWHLGELIYGPMFRGESKLDAVGRWHVENYLAARGALQVIILPELSIVMDRLARRGDDMVSLEQISEIHSRYGIFSREDEPNLTTTVIGCDDALTCGKHEQSIVDELVSWAFAGWLRTRALRAFPSYVGSPSPDYLILGERRNDPVTYEAAFVPTGASSGRYMLEHLLPALGDKTIGLANALEENVYRLWVSLGRPPTIALGNEAWRVAQQFGIPVSGVPHPQFVRRFHHKSGALYARTIISALSTGEDLRSWRPA